MVCCQVWKALCAASMAACVECLDGRWRHVLKRSYVDVDRCCVEFVDGMKTNICFVSKRVCTKSWQLPECLLWTCQVRNTEPEADIWFSMFFSLTSLSRTYLQLTSPVAGLVTSKVCPDFAPSHLTLVFKACEAYWLIFCWCKIQEQAVKQVLLIITKFVWCHGFYWYSVNVRSMGRQ